MNAELVALHAYVGTTQKVEAAAKETRAEPWHKWPTIRDLAKRFGLSQQTTLEIVEDSDRLDLCVGVGVNGGAARFERVGDYRVEWIGGDE